MKACPVDSEEFLEGPLTGMHPRKVGGPSPSFSMLKGSGLKGVLGASLQILGQGISSQALGFLQQGRMPALTKAFTECVSGGDSPRGALAALLSAKEEAPIGTVYGRKGCWWVYGKVMEGDFSKNTKKYVAVPQFYNSL